MKATELKNVIDSLNKKEYERAFCRFYFGKFITQKKDVDLFNTLIKSDRCGGDFFKACTIYEMTIEMELEKIENAKKSKKVKDFVKEYKEWSSGYSMGEKVHVKYVTEHRTSYETIRDTREVYSGSGKKYNNNIKYGEILLVVDLTGSKNKYNIYKISK